MNQRETNDLVCFKGICTFVKDLTCVFEKNHPLALYNRLLEKTPISNTKIISKHISLFRDYIIQNKDAILEQNPEKIVSDKISYNETVLIQIKRFVTDSDKETKLTIFKHLQYIGSLCCEDSLSFKKSLREKELGDSKEEKFLGNLINKVESTIDPTTMDNPLTAVTQLLSSGVLNDVIGNLQTGLSSGDLDIGKLLGSMQMIAGGPQGSSSSSSQQTPMPDLSAMMNMLPGLMSAMGGMGSGAMNTPSPSPLNSLRLDSTPAKK
jgi:hypothetical protein